MCLGIYRLQTNQYASSNARPIGQTGAGLHQEDQWRLSLDLLRALNNTIYGTIELELHMNVMLRCTHINSVGGTSGA